MNPPARSPRHRRTLTALTALLAVSAGCADAPTAPALAEWLARSEPLAAVLPPEQLPPAGSWLPMSGATPAAARLSELEGAADAAFRRGQLGAAARYRSEAGVLAATSLHGLPDARLLHTTREAVDLWLLRVERSTGGETSPAVGALLRPVMSGRDAAAASLAAGDTVAAARSLVRSAEEIRGVAPRLAVLRVLEGAESRVAALDPRGREAERARHLVSTAREALAADDAVRALQRAVYASQIARGQQLAEVDPEE